MDALPAESPHQLVKLRRLLFPLRWRIFVAAGLLGAYVVGTVDEAASYIVMAIVAFIAVLMPMIRYARHGRGRQLTRAAPLVLFLLLLAGLLAAVRVDDLTGNLVPTRFSFRWQPRRDELLLPPAPTDSGSAVDLTATTVDDFPEFLGPGRLASVSVSLSSDWQKTPPELIWHHDRIGAGWSGFAAVNGYAVTMEQRGVQELVTCYEIATGGLAWSYGTPTRHATVPGGVGPRSTPTIYNGRVYTLGATGELQCLAGHDGSLVWRQNLLEEIGTTPEEDLVHVAWGRAASPLIDEGRVIVPLGGPTGPSLVAYDALTGTLLWKHGRRQVSYASPMITTLAGTRQIVLVCQDFVCGHDATSGELLWEFPWPGLSNSMASCSQPVWAGADRLFLSKGYAYGAALIEVRPPSAEKSWEAKQVWHKRTVMKTKFTNVVLFENHAYGLDDSILSCVAVDSGRRLWKRGRYGHGQVLRAHDKLLVQAESGEVALVKLTPERFQELARFAPLQGKTWNNPCLYGPFLLIRNSEEAACYRLPLSN